MNKQTPDSNASTSTIEAALAAQEAKTSDAITDITDPITDNRADSAADSGKSVATDAENHATIEPKEPRQPSPGFLGILQSVLAAMIGVQSDEKRQQDFEKGHPATFIFVGIVMVIIFILVIVSVVNSALEGTGIPH